MDIGNNIRSARVRAGLTQEQAAERLLVSRQTISNWENNKTIPDALQIQSICTEYGVSAEWLINDKTVDVQESQLGERDDEPFSLGENTLKFLTLGYLGCWILCVLCFWLGGSSGAFALFYALLVLRILFPVATFVASVLLGFLNCYPLYRFFYIFGFGLMHSLLPYFTYSFANTILSGNLHALDIEQFFFGLCLSAVGILFGWVIRFFSMLMTKWMNRSSEHQTS